jgi:hypothetical protein
LAIRVRQYRTRAAGGGLAHGVDGITELVDILAALALAEPIDPFLRRLRVHERGKETAS